MLDDQHTRAGGFAGLITLHRRLGPAAPVIALVVVLTCCSPSAAARPVTKVEDSTVSLSAGERINAVFRPAVEQMKRVLFWDPFAAVGLHDPVIRGADGGPLLDSAGEPRKASIPFVVVWLVIAAVFFSARMHLINFRGFALAVKLILGRYHDPRAGGEVTHFQALATALSATVGLGNIAGVAIAVSVGGPGATFWMIVAGLLGMATKFTECTLGVKYREIDEQGRVSGGPMYYLSAGLARRGMARTGKTLGAVYAFFMVLGSLGGGNMFQANQSFSLLSAIFPVMEGNGVYYGIALAVLVGVVIIGGLQGIARVTGKIVPLMAVLYISVSLYIIGANIHNIGFAVAEIFWGAFDAPAVKGGIIGVLVMGFRRAAFSNEAGVGTASIAHSAARTDHPVAEGIVALHEPFIDTVVICTMTALVLIFTGHHQTTGMAGAQLTSAAFGSVVSWFPYLLTLAIFLFAFSTLISFSYYGIKCFDYLVGDLFERALGRRDIAAHVYRAIFLSFTVIGAASSLGAVMDFSDMIVLSLAFPNTIGLYVMASEVKADLDSYLRRIRSGEIKQTR